ncbi:MAG: glutamate 5-kinase [Candidatus Sericytochromatia bacterium]
MDNYKKIVIKIGTNVLTQDNGLLNLNVIQNLVYQISELKKKGLDVILVSSGAMGAGRSLIKLSDKTNDVVKRQILASIGQPKLINIYSEFFKEQGFICAQILATKEDFRDRTHYLNMKNCFNALLQDNIIPIVNENDVVSITELMFTDNDELAGLIASMMSVDALILLTNVDGIFDGDPKNKDSKVIPLIQPEINKFSNFVSKEKSQFGRGGMITKCGIGHKMSLVGITTHIANGKKENILLELYDKKEIGTKFLLKKEVSNIKKRVALSEGYEKGIIFINNGAKDALLSEDKAHSLLPIGVIKIEGTFEKGDIVKINDENNNNIGLGIVQTTSAKAINQIGKKGQKPLIHYDYLFLKG